MPNRIFYEITDHTLYILNKKSQFCPTLIHCLRKKTKPMKNFKFSLLLLIFWWITACNVKPAINTTPKDVKQTLILVSFDGCRHDYPDSANTPALDAMAKNGIKASGLKTVFPSKTFPNHISIVTGLYPAHHGIISNRIYDAKTGDWYKLSNGAPTQSKWYHGEPIWSTAERQGIKTATFFWPASEAKIGGFRPTYWKPYNGKIPYNDRVEQALKWLDLPKAERPRFISLYFDEPDHSGHKFGPLSPESIKATERVDSQLANLWTGIKERHLESIVNVIVVSDHGMTQLSRDSVIFLNDYINMNDVKVIDWSPVTSIRPLPGYEDAVYNALKDAHPHMHIYRKGEVPAKYHYNDNEFIQPIVAISDLHWTIAQKSYFQKHPKKATGGTHGYDPDYQDMDGILYAQGPAFKKGYQAPLIQNIHLYDLMCRVLNIEPAQNDGDPTKTLELMRK